jgi:hypothetical protein
VAHQPLAARIVQKLCVLCHECRHLGLHGGSQQLARSGLDDLCQRVR